MAIARGVAQLPLRIGPLLGMGLRDSKGLGTYLEEFGGWGLRSLEVACIRSGVHSVLAPRLYYCLGYGPTSCIERKGLRLQVHCARPRLKRSSRRRIVAHRMLKPKTDFVRHMCCCVFRTPLAALHCASPQHSSYHAICRHFQERSTESIGTFCDMLVEQTVYDVARTWPLPAPSDSVTSASSTTCARVSRNVSDTSFRVVLEDPRLPWPSLGLGLRSRLHNHRSRYQPGRMVSSHLDDASLLVMLLASTSACGLCENVCITAFTSQHTNLSPFT